MFTDKGRYGDRFPNIFAALKPNGIFRRYFMSHLNFHCSGYTDIFTSPQIVFGGVYFLNKKFGIQQLNLKTWESLTLWKWLFYICFSKVAFVFTGNKQAMFMNYIEKVMCLFWHTCSHLLFTHFKNCLLMMVNIIDFL